MFYHVVVKGNRAVCIQAARSKSDAQQAVINLTVRSVYERTDTEPFSVRSFWTKAGAAAFIKQSLGCS